MVRKANETIGSRTFARSLALAALFLFDALTRRNVPRVLLAAALFALAGCNTPLRQSRMEQRRSHMSNVVGRIEQREAGRPEELAKAGGWMRDQHAYHQDHLYRTSDMVEEEWESDIDRWYNQSEKRQRFWGAQWRGDPESIPSTWAKMVY